jgi:D-tagatose-1,6-bisphosphate aldolase subunit GatZ/KbaZ
LEQLMLQHPVHWRSHYRGTEEECRRMLLSSRLDRIRCYWRHPEAQAALDRLHRNLAPSVPGELVERYVGDPASILSSGEPDLTPSGLIRRRIRTVLEPYVAACR